MDIFILFDFLKILWLGFDMWKHIKNREKEKTLAKQLNAINQRLDFLEDKIKKLKS